MDCAKTANLIYARRRQQGLTQKQLADTLGLSDKTISKWEKGLGCPDVSLLTDVAAALELRVEDLLTGSCPDNPAVAGNLKKAQYCVCPRCGNLTVSAGDAVVTCCGRRLLPLTPQKAAAEQKLHIEQIEDDWFITADHPMEKDHYLSFLAFVTGDRLQLIKLYPEWTMQVRLHKDYHGMLLWYCTQHGLFYQYL